MKRYIAGIGVTLIAITLIFLISLSSAAPTMQSINIADPETQFDLKIAYSYVGPGPLNAAYTADDGSIMAPVSLNPSTVVLNITRIPETKFSSCDALIEFYKIQITTDTGISEKACYFIGTNYKPSFSNSELSALLTHTKDFTSRESYFVAIGGFKFNMTDNTSFVSPPIGSYGCYSGTPSKLGLWTAGEPNSIFVSVQRIGYIAMNDGSVSIYNDATTSNAKL